MNKDIADVIADIQRVAILINLETKHHVFVRDHGHIKQFEVQIYFNGWGEFKEPYLSDEIDYDDKDEDILKILKLIRDTLRKFYKNGRINKKRFYYDIKEVKQYRFREC